MCFNIQQKFQFNEFQNIMKIYCDIHDIRYTCNLNIRKKYNEDICIFSEYDWETFQPGM